MSSSDPLASSPRAGDHVLNQHSPATAKITLFRSLFRGRDDVYPLLLDETCFFLAVDFDKEGWQADSIAFLRGCRRLGLTAALERSRSGRGGHAWLFFEGAVPALWRADSGRIS